MEVGDYVRTIYGIKKVVDIECGQDVRFDNTDGFDDDLRRYHNYDGISFNGSTWKEIVERTSPNIIDLIEVGDYVNGMIVHCVYADSDEIVVGGLDILIQNTLVTLRSNNIKSIVTKEQFKEVEYIVKED